MRKRKQPFYDRGHALSIEGTCNSDDARFKIHGLLPGERALIQPLKKQRGAGFVNRVNTKTCIQPELFLLVVTRAYAEDVLFNMSLDQSS